VPFITVDSKKKTSMCCVKQNWAVNKYINFCYKRWHIPLTQLRVVLMGTLRDAFGMLLVREKTIQKTYEEMEGQH